MQKFSIKSRVFLSFTIFVIIIVNIFSWALFSFAVQNMKIDTKKNMINEFETIKTLINLEKNSIFILPKIEIEKINNLWFYFYIWNNDKNLQKKYKIGFIEENDNLIFRWDYNDYNIILWKTNKELKNFEKKYYELLLFLNIFLIILSFFISYFITKFSLDPLFNLSKFLDNYKFDNKNNLIKNNYSDTEIGLLTKAINKFIKQNNNILESQKDFIQDINHELKTPLMQIDSNIELIEDKIENTKIKQKLENIKNSSSNINEIISNLWFILRWKEVLKKKEKINLYNYLQNFIKKYEILANKKNIKIKIIKNFDLILENNSYYLDRFFWNIISNAIAYNNWNNEIKIILDKNKIEIIDEGIWIEKDELEKIFDRFYRNKNSNIYYQNWNWLWLVIVKKIALMFGWKIEVKSEKVKGTNFSIFL